MLTHRSIFNVIYLRCTCFFGKENASRLIIISWPWLMKRVQRAMKTVRGGERNWDRERERENGETLCSSSSCYFNPDSALKYGHHVDSLKKCGSSIGLANKRRRNGPGRRRRRRRDVGRVRESWEREALKRLSTGGESGQRSHISRRAGLSTHQWRQVGLDFLIVLHSFPI